MTNKLQIVLTSYIRPKYLIPTVESLRQDDIELYITDGGSDEETIKFIKENSDGYLLFQGNPGADTLKSEGIKKFITNKEFLLTSDDLVYPKGYSELILENYEKINKDGLKWDYCACSFDHYLKRFNEKYQNINGVEIMPVATCQVAGAIINLKLCKSVGYFPTYGRSGMGDWSYSKRMRELGIKMGYWKNVIIDHIGASKKADYPEYTKEMVQDASKYKEIAKKDLEKRKG